MKSLKSCNKAILAFAVAAAILITAVFLAGIIKKPADNATLLLRKLYTIKADQSSKLSDDLQAVIGIYEENYGEYMTKEGFDLAIESRTFMRIADKGGSLKSDITVKKVQLEKKDVVEDRAGRELHRYHYQVVCSTAGTQKQEINFTGELNLIKSEDQWFVDRLEPDF